WSVSFPFPRQSYLTAAGGWVGSILLENSKLAPLPALASPCQDCLRVPEPAHRFHGVDPGQGHSWPGAATYRTWTREAQTVGAPAIVSVEVERPSGRLREWEDALSAHVGRVDPVLREQEAVRCLLTDERPFMGRSEYGALGEMLLCKVTSTNHRFTRSLTTPTPTLPIPAMLVSVSRGSCKFVQRGRTCILTPGDWTLIDTNQPHGYAITSPEIEAFVIMLPRPSDAAIVALCELGVARRWNGRTGLSRVLHAMVNESFGEMRRLPRFSGRKLGAAITAMAWDALREQIETPPVIGHRDELSIRVKACIEESMQTYGVCSGLGRFWAHGERVSWCRRPHVRFRPRGTREGK